MAIAAQALAAPLLNGLSTSDWLLLALARGHVAVAGVDIVLLLTGGLALTAARRLRRVDAARQARTAAASGQKPEEMDRANHA